ncbi:hypothetical protein [Acinetobacter baumannii]|uniref:hypothetical protein n=1 Tax=Acinetobacter baumannii TaxID=470 RepID=UPI00313DD64D
MVAKILCCSWLKANVGRKRAHQPAGRGRVFGALVNPPATDRYQTAAYAAKSVYRPVERWWALPRRPLNEGQNRLLAYWSLTSSTGIARTFACPGSALLRNNTTTLFANFSMAERFTATLFFPAASSRFPLFGCRLMFAARLTGFVGWNFRG